MGTDLAGCGEFSIRLDGSFDPMQPAWMYIVVEDALLNFMEIVGASVSSTSGALYSTTFSDRAVVEAEWFSPHWNKEGCVGDPGFCGSHGSVFVIDRPFLELHGSGFAMQATIADQACGDIVSTGTWINNPDSSVASGWCGAVSSRTVCDGAYRRDATLYKNAAGEGDINMIKRCAWDAASARCKGSPFAPTNCPLPGGRGLGLSTASPVYIEMTFMPDWLAPVTTDGDIGILLCTTTGLMEWTQSYTEGCAVFQMAHETRPSPQSYVKSAVGPDRQEYDRDGLNRCSVSPFSTLQIHITSGSITFLDMQSNGAGCAPITMANPFSMSDTLYAHIAVDESSHLWISVLDFKIVTSTSELSASVAAPVALTPSTCEDRINLWLWLGTSSCA